MRTYTQTSTLVTRSSLGRHYCKVLPQHSCQCLVREKLSDVSAPHLASFLKSQGQNLDTQPPKVYYKRWVSMLDNQMVLIKLTMDILYVHAEAMEIPTSTLSHLLWTFYLSTQYPHSGDTGPPSILLCDATNISEYNIWDCSFNHRASEKPQLELPEEPASHGTSNCDGRWYKYAIPYWMHRLGVDKDYGAYTEANRHTINLISINVG